MYSRGKIDLPFYPATYTSLLLKNVGGREAEVKSVCVNCLILPHLTWTKHVDTTCSSGNKLYETSFKNCLANFIRSQLLKIWARSLCVQSVTFSILVVKDQAWRTEAWCAHSLTQSSTKLWIIKKIKNNGDMDGVPLNNTNSKSLF